MKNLGVLSMQSKTIVTYILLGLSYRYVQDAREGMIIHKESYILSNINKIIKHFDTLNLKVTKRAAAKLYDIRDRLAETDEDSKLSKDQARELFTTLTDLQSTLIAETSGMFAFIVVDKRIETKKLLDNLSHLFNPIVYDEIPEEIKFDFNEAGKCIAFERSTAGAFHILRGTEGVLRWYYCSFCKRKRVKPLNWKPMLDHLKRRREKQPLEIINNLDHIRVAFRNPTQHPDKIYDIQEVQDLLFVCIDTINRMVKNKIEKYGRMDLKIKVSN